MVSVSLRTLGNSKMQSNLGTINAPEIRTAKEFRSRSVVGLPGAAARTTRGASPWALREN